MKQRDFTVNRRVVWISLVAAVVGVLGAVAALVLTRLIAFFTNLFFYQRISLEFASPATAHIGPWVLIIPVIGGLIIGLMARFGSDKIRGHGIPEALESILFNKSRLSPKVAILKPVSAAISIGSGGPFGAEGPIIMTGGACGSLIAQFMHLTSFERKTLLVAGAAAGMAAVFDAPLASIVIAVELLLFEMKPRSLIPVAIAASVAAALRPYFMGHGPLFPVPAHEVVGVTGLFSSAVMGIGAGILAMILTYALYACEDGFEKLKFHWMWYPAIGGAVIGLGGFFQPRALGIGTDVISDILNGSLTPHEALPLLLVKATIWIVALGSGTSGGVLAPVLMIGGGLGVVLGPLLPGGTVALWALISTASVFGAVIGSPLTAVVFALELTHDWNSMVPLLIGCTISYSMTSLMMKRSIMTEKIARRGKPISREYGVDPSERVLVREVMTAGENPGQFDPTRIAHEDESCGEALRRMMRLGVDSLFVISNEDSSRVIGTVTRHDLLTPHLRQITEDHATERFYGAAVMRIAGRGKGPA